MITGPEELERFYDRKATAFSEAFRRLAHARLFGKGYDTAINDLRKTLQATLILSNLQGRKRTLMEADYMSRKQSRFDGTKTPLSGLVFEEAVEDLLSREPRLENSSRELSRLYNTDHVFGMARSIDLVLTERVQKALVELERSGVGFFDAEKVLAEITPFTRSYAAVVYRTNLSTNYNIGRMQQAADPEVAEIIPALEYNALTDARTRHNHAAASGLIAATKDPIWKTFTPPLGYNCRCSVETLSRWELERKGLLRKDGSVVRFFPPTFSMAHPDENFKVGAAGWEAA
jgi:SPP1 gp7 family putative phage head morphogenesis protein